MSGPSSKQSSEFVVKVPELNDMKRFSVLKFNSSIKIDPTTWANPEVELNMEREENRVLTSGLPAVQEFGEGSEYGKAAREEARRKKLGRIAKTYSIDKQPWKMRIKESDGKEKKLQSIREGGAGKHADYWLFLKNGDEFLAYKVDDWHNFVPCITHRTLDIDEAEEEFTKRNRVMNQFALRAQIMDKMKQKDADDESEMKKVKGLKIKDAASSDSDGDNEGDKEDEDNGERKKKKTKKGAKPRNDKKVKVENSDEVAKYESEDGEDEGREYDYMSDSGSDSDREDIPMEEKVEKALVGVAEEEGMRKMMDSDESDSDEEQDPAKKLLKRSEEEDKKRRIDIEERDSSGSDSEVEDIDKDMKDSVILMPKKGGSPDGSNTISNVQGTKRSAVEPPEGPEVKKAKEEKEEGLSEEMVRKLLRTKPHTTKELLSKIKSRCGGELPKSEMVTRLATILKAIEPHQFKQKQGKKDVLFFSLANTIS